jgi:hypothetical protein
VRRRLLGLGPKNPLAPPPEIMLQNPVLHHPRRLGKTSVGVTRPPLGAFPLHPGSPKHLFLGRDLDLITRRRRRRRVVCSISEACPCARLVTDQVRCGVTTDPPLPCPRARGVPTPAGRQPAVWWGGVARGPSVIFRYFLPLGRRSARKIFAGVFCSPPWEAKRSQIFAGVFTDLLGKRNARKISAGVSAAHNVRRKLG